jgi:hypothetical protein
LYGKRGDDEDCGGDGGIMGIHAVIKGKISSTGSNLNQRLEDLMTSNIFQNISYLSFEEGLYKILDQAVSIDDRKIEFIQNEEILSTKYSFWPNLKNSQPDVVIELKIKNSKIIRVFVEAKLYSSLSGDDQLDREYKDMIERNETGNNVLIYLTQHSAYPREDFQNLRSCHRNAFWLNYEMIYNALKANNNNNLVIRDVLNLLRHYDFCPFDEWKNLEKITEKYTPVFDDIIGWSQYLQTIKYQKQWITEK